VKTDVVTRLAALAPVVVVCNPLSNLGRAVQVEPMKPVLKAPGTMLLKLRCDEPLSHFPFNSICAATPGAAGPPRHRAAHRHPHRPRYPPHAAVARPHAGAGAAGGGAGAHTRPLLSST